MKNKMLMGCAYASMTFFLAFICLWLFALVADPHVNVGTSEPSCPHISFGNDINATVTKHWGGNVVFFNQEFPYTGSIISFGDDDTVKVKSLDAPGIYFRQIKKTTRTDNWWTLMFSFWYPIIVFSILPLVFLFRNWRSARKA